MLLHADTGGALARADRRWIDGLTWSMRRREPWSMTISCGRSNGGVPAGVRRLARGPREDGTYRRAGAEVTFLGMTSSPAFVRQP